MENTHTYADLGESSILIETNAKPDSSRIDPKHLGPNGRLL